VKKIIILSVASLLFSYELKEFVVCKDIKNLTPINPSTTFTTSDKKVYAFAYFKNVEKKRDIDFVWEKYVNKKWHVYTQVKLSIFTSKRWRTDSYITIKPFFKGKWRVTIFDNNKTIASKEFEIVSTNSKDKKNP